MQAVSRGAIWARASRPGFSALVRELSDLTHHSGRNCYPASRVVWQGCDPLDLLVSAGQRWLLSLMQPCQAGSKQRVTLRTDNEILCTCFDKLRVASSLKLTYRFVRLRRAGTDAQNLWSSKESHGRRKRYNHGERALDGTPASLTVLRASQTPCRVASAPIIMDGIRRAGHCEASGVGDGGRCGGLKASTAGKTRVADLRRSGRAARWRRRGGARHCHLPPASCANTRLATS